MHTQLQTVTLYCYFHLPRNFVWLPGTRQYLFGGSLHFSVRQNLLPPSQKCRTNQAKRINYEKELTSQF